LRVHLHLVSDSTGETVTTVARACVAQFEGVIPVEHVWSFVRTRAQVDQVLSVVKALPGVVIYTLISPELRQALHEGSRGLNIPCVAVLDGVLSALSSLLGAETRPQIGRQHALDAVYFSRIDAMTFMLRHDDGQCAEELEQADVVLIGVSRTSKTPTSIYLANRGIKVANIPVVPDCPLPAELEGVRAELVHARRLFARHGWPVIDVTRRSVEETAAAIFQLLQAREGPRVPAAGTVEGTP
jgi:regulator of PEP synthase PpsR (kinase-PPPase family)